MRILVTELEKIVCVSLLVAMTVLGFVNIVVRYATDYSFAASEELLTNGFLLLTIFGAAIAARRGEHLAVTLVAEALPALPRRGVFLLSLALSLMLLGLTAWFIWQLLQNQRGTGVRSYALQVPMWYYTAALPLGFALILVRTVEHAVRRMRHDALDSADPPHV
ncbi:TRAP transporter small permease [Rhodobacteraceae bacterium MCCB 386]|nr:TRAP transporter small permease [Roseitranquillus sediminis]